LDTTEHDKRDRLLQELQDLMNGPGAHGLEGLSVLAHDGYMGPGNTRSNLAHGAESGFIQVDDSTRLVQTGWSYSYQNYYESSVINGVPMQVLTTAVIARPVFTVRTQEVMYAASLRQESMSPVKPATFHFGRFLYLNSRHPMRVLAFACTGFVIGAAATSPSGPFAGVGAGYGMMTGVVVAEVTFLAESRYSDSTGPPPEPDDPPPGLGRFTSQPTSEPIPPPGQPAGE
jgi:hypothetical protein